MLKSKDVDAKYEYAIQLYNKGLYYKALPLFEEIVAVYRGTKKAEQSYYYYAYTNYRLGDYETAAFDFDNFSRSFPLSEFAEECAYMKAFCFVLLSPKYSLDQTSTKKAIYELQLFIDQNPRSLRIAECNKLIDDLREKLETKDFENAKLYFHMNDYKASVTAFSNLLKEFPSSKFKEEAMFLSFKASFLLAENSIEIKKSERYNTALVAYGEFISHYPDSKYKKEADNHAENIRKILLLTDNQ